MSQTDVRVQAVVCGIRYGLRTNPGIRCFGSLQFNSPIDDAKYTSNAVLCSLHLTYVRCWKRCRCSL